MQGNVDAVTAERESFQCGYRRLVHSECTSKARTNLWMDIATKKDIFASIEIIPSSVLSHRRIFFCWYWWCWFRILYYGVCIFRFVFFMYRTRMTFDYLGPTIYYLSHIMVLVTSWLETCPRAAAFLPLPPSFTWIISWNSLPCWLIHLLPSVFTRYWYFPMTREPWGWRQWRVLVHIGHRSFSVSERPDISNANNQDSSLLAEPNFPAFSIDSSILDWRPQTNTDSTSTTYLSTNSDSDRVMASSDIVEQCRVSQSLSCELERADLLHAGKRF